VQYSSLKNLFLQRNPRENFEWKMPYVVGFGLIVFARAIYGDTVTALVIDKVHLFNGSILIPANACDGLTSLNIQDIERKILLVDEGHRIPPGSGKMIYSNTMVVV
jgi:hypothetical protein